MPEYPRQVSLAHNWFGFLSPDLFSGFQNPSHQVRVPCNIAGCALPFQDSSYVGVATTKGDTPITIGGFHHGECITQKMKKKLRSGAKYNFSFQTIQSDTSLGYFENAFVIFSRDDPKTLLDWQYKLLVAKHSQYFPFVTDTLNWQKAEYTFTASGGEQYMLFGILDSAKYFIPYSLPLPLSPGRRRVTSYYYIDDVRLVELPDTLSSELTLPNTFTPNGDLQNDVWRPIANNIASYSLQVFNRYGALIYEQSGPEVEWNGEAPNGPASEGVYFMVLQAKGNEGKEYTERQTVHLFR